jgi:hypothetical protein
LIALSANGAIADNARDTSRSIGPGIIVLPVIARTSLLSVDLRLLTAIDKTDLRYG